MMPPYTTGTLAATNGLTAIVGTGTAWAVNLVTGGIICFDGGSYAITAVTDDTHLTIYPPFAGSTGAGKLYAVARETSAAVQAVFSYDRLTEILNRLADAGSLGSDAGWLMNWDTGTSDADPGAGNIRANNATITSATILYVSKTTRAGSDIGALLNTLDDATSAIRGLLVLTNPVTEEQLTAYVSACTDATGYVKIALSGIIGEATFPDEAPVSMQFYRSGDLGTPIISVLTADRTGSDVNTAQAVFGSSEDTLTVLASTTYRFKAEIVITRAAGTTSHTMGFLLAGTATFTAIDGVARVSNPTGNVLGAVNAIQITAATETVLTAANTSATENVRISIEGVMRINGAGTIIPQFKFSAAPGGAPTIKRNSFFEAVAIGSNTVAAVGPWA